MKKRISILFLSSLLLLGACGGNNKKVDPTANPTPTPTQSEYHYTPQDISARDVNLPTEIPTMDEPSFQIHYRREDNKGYKDWGLWLWDPSNSGADDGIVDPFNYQDDYGVIGYYPISYLGECEGRKIGFIVRKIDSWSKDISQADLFIDMDSIIPDSHQCYHIYLISGDSNIYSGPNKTFPDAVKYCAFVDEKNIKLTTTNKLLYYKLYKDNALIKTGEGVIPYPTVDISLPQAYPVVEITSSYKMEVTFKETGNVITVPVSVSELYNSDVFNALNYDGELGAIYSGEKTIFRVWSPISSSIKLRIYNNGTPKSVDASKGDDTYEEHAMTLKEKGVFEATVSGDLDGKYYTYVVTNANFTNKEIVDPYAKSAGVNGLRGQIVNFAKTNPEGWDEVTPYQYDRNELTVWETHVADVTSHSSWTGSEVNRRRFLGLVEEGTTFVKGTDEVSTGFDHIVELGVNAVQLLPIFDQANDELNYSFNWGYNPLNYNVVEGLYSSDPHNGYARINELKQVVMKFLGKGINTIMDVVYNHVNSANGSNFDVLMPGSYYRYNADGSLGNGSGCGNETASEMPMMRKFMIDSTTFWAKEYKLGGFRFDLMGLHDLETMNQLTAECKKINPAIVIYGEPWTGGDTPMKDFAKVSAKQSNGNKYQGYGQFNDAMRDALIKGGLNSANSLGWVTNMEKVVKGDISAIKKGIAGSTAASPEIADPNKTVNYVTCHDNYTLRDRIRATATTSEYVKPSMLANSVVFTSQGTAFMLAGEEMLRTKNGNSNSYNAPDSVNQYNYNRKITYHDMFNNYKALIAFKQEVGQLHDSTCTVDVKELADGAILYYTLTSGDTEYMVVHANAVSNTATLDLSAYSVYHDTLGELEVGSALPSNFHPNAYQTLIAIKN